MERYDHLLKHFDLQLLNQLKDREYDIQKINMETVEKDKFHDRLIKIETEGLSRNRLNYEFIDDKKEFDQAKVLFYNEISLALRDGLITAIGNLKSVLL